MRLMIVSPEYGVDASGEYRPGGLAQFARATARALSMADEVRELAIWGLLDEPAALTGTLARYIDEARRSGVRVSYRGFSGDRPRMAVAFAAENLRYDHVMFLHIGVGRLANLRPIRPYSLWLVGIEVRHRLRWYERRVVHNARPLMSISRYSSDQMQVHNPDLPAARAVHLCLEPDGAWAQGSRPALDYDAAERELAVMIVARMAASERYKGHDELIAAWPRVTEAVPGAELWIVGDGDDRPRLTERADGLPPAIRARIRFTGRVSHDELLDLYSRSRVFAMPSTGEGFGLVFVEAMNYGQPCISSRDSAAEIVAHGETGLVVDQDPAQVADACVTLLTDDALANRMSAAGRVRLAERFRFDAFRDRLYEVMDLAAPSPRR